MSLSGLENDGRTHLRDAVFWFDRNVTTLPSLAGAVSADVVVVGGGMMGLMCARTLLARGQRVCLLEAETCGSGASGRSSGLITPDSELEFQDLLRQFGSEEGPRLWEFASGGVEAIRQAVLQDQIDCDMQVQDALYVAGTPGGAEVISSEYAARQAFGYPGTLYSRESLPAILGSTTYFSALRFGETFGIDGYGACTGLRQRLLDAGGRVYERSPVTRILDTGVETPEGSVQAPAVVLCADRFLPALGLARREVYHAQTFLAITERLEQLGHRPDFSAGSPDGLGDSHRLQVFPVDRTTTAADRRRHAGKHVFAARETPARTGGPTHDALSRRTLSGSAGQICGVLARPHRDIQRTLPQ